MRNLVLSSMVSSAIAFAGTAVAAPPITLPTGQLLTPTAAPGATFSALNPNIPSLPNYTAGQGVSSAVSPDGKTLLVLTSGYNRELTATGGPNAAASNEYVFVYDISTGHAAQKQVVQVPNTFVGLAFAPSGNAFYVSGGVDDSLHTFNRVGGAWTESVAPIKLNNGAGNGLTKGIAALGIPAIVGAQAAGLAVSADGGTVVVANYENDSISIVNVGGGTSVSYELRPGKINPGQSGVAGGEFPYWVVFKGNDTVYVSSQRDREIVAVTGLPGSPSVAARIALKGNPNKMILNKAESRLFVASDNSDTVDVIDTASNTLISSISTTSPGIFSHPKGPGSIPNSLALGPHEDLLYVTNAGSNSVAVIALNRGGGGQVIGLIPTGWYPNSVSVSADGRMLYVVNAKSSAGPNPGNCTNVDVGPGGATPAPVQATACPDSLQNGSANQYIWQLTKAGLLTLPVPGPIDLALLTARVALNNGFVAPQSPRDEAVMAGLRQNIQHVIYIVKENRTYDQVLGDLPAGNGDRTLTQFPKSITPNFHSIASNFVLLDNFYCSSEVSMDGWQWSTGARTVDADEKATPVNYANRGLFNDSEGTSRDVNVALPNNAARAAALSVGAEQGNGVPPLPAAIQFLTQAPLSSLADPDNLPGTAYEFGLDGPDGELGAGYIWDAALRAGKTVRNYGFFLDLTLYNVPPQIGGLAPIPDPHGANVQVAVPANVALAPYTDPYFRGFDNAFPDFFRYTEWQREFNGYVANGNLPQLELLRVMHDHMGNFDTAIAGVNTPELQQADDDYAVGLIVQAVANSPYAANTLIFVLEDDAQDGADHVDAHRSTAYIVGPYVKQGATVSRHYTTVNMLRTIEDVLGLQHLNIHDEGVAPMADVFDLSKPAWTFAAAPSAYLYNTQLPLPPRAAGLKVPRPSHTAAWWAAKTKGMDFSAEDRIDSAAFNRIVWLGLKGDKPYPVVRGGGKEAAEDGEHEHERKGKSGT